MAKNPFRDKVKDVKDIQFWVDETFKQYAETHQDEPVGAFVIAFGKSGSGNSKSRTVALAWKSFQAGDNNFTSGDLIKHLADIEFNMRFDLATKVRKNIAKKK